VAIDEEMINGVLFGPMVNVRQRLFWGERGLPGFYIKYRRQKSICLWY
jgi:hypothetical protein